MNRRSTLESDSTVSFTRRVGARARRDRSGVSALAPLVDQVEEPTARAPTTGTEPSAAASHPAKAPAGRIKANRGVDTLFRNAYRSQLDMLALAATKANIMISLNGLLMSMLIISGTHFVSIDALYIFPISLFLVTCALATVFAVFAARPDISKRRFRKNDFESDQAHLLVFEEFSDLNEEEYIDAMSTMLGDRQRVYRNMIAHVHELGSTADRKYRDLYYSYTVFMVGMLVSVALLLGLEALKWWGLLPVV